MPDLAIALQARLERLYQRSDTDVDFTRFLAEQDVGDDDDLLAELIESDGRFRITRGLDVDLDRYLHAVTDLPRRDVPLDAAIDVTLRSMSGAGRAAPEVVHRLVERHPDLERPIREAGVLGEALISTAGLQSGLHEEATRPLPSDFGPLMPNGEARYEMRELLGKGAFGQVYLAVDRQLSEPGHAAHVAIKILSSRGRTPWARRRLADEATKARRIDHVNVVRVVDRGVTGGNEDYIVHEFVGGGDLADWMQERGGTLPPVEAASIVARIARGVQAAHSAGLVHCDLKPGNVMMSVDGEPKVADFGIAARIDDDLGPAPSRPDGDERPLGNLAFIAPEQYRREEGATNIPADLYALGGILYLLVTGVLPNGASVEEIERTHDTEHGRASPPRLRDAAPGTDRDLDLICRRAMALRPEDRHSAAATLAEDLETWCRREPVRWTRPTTLRVLKLWMRRKPALAAMVALLFLSIVAGGVIGFQLQQQRQWEQALRTSALGFAGKMRLLVAKDRRPTTEILSGVWVAEAAFGPWILGVPGDRTDYWQARIDAVRLDLGEAGEAGRDDELLALLAETQLAFWLVRDGDFEEAEPLLASNRAAWSRVLEEDDLWLVLIDAVQAAAAVNRITARASASGELSPEARAEAEALEARLVAARETMRREARGRPAHHLVLASLRTLNAPELLDRPEAVADAAEEADRLLHPER